jgi:hypothetical protein
LFEHVCHLSYFAATQKEEEKRTRFRILKLTSTVVMITHPASPTSPSSSAFVPAVPAPSTSTPAPDSPRLSQTPPPTGLQGDLEVELVGLANALYNLGTTVISDLSREKDKPGVGKQVGLRV